MSVISRLLLEGGNGLGASGSVTKEPALEGNDGKG